MRRSQVLPQALPFRSLASLALVAAMLVSVAADAANPKAVTAKKKGAKEAAPPPAAVAPPPPAPASTKKLEEKLKKDEAADEGLTRLAPAALPPRGGEVSKDAKADAARDAEIESIKKVLTRQKDPNIKAQLLFKLGELWWEKSRFVYSQEMDAWKVEADKWNACMQKKTVKECGAEPIPNTRKSELYRANAVDLYRQVIRDYPKYARLDEIRFILAYNLSDMANGTRVEVQKKKYYDEAVRIYMDLIALHPKSDFVSDAHVELCNYYFDHKPADLTRAELACQAAMKLKKVRTETYATYKMAWIRYNQGQYGEVDEPKKGDIGSVGYLKKVIDMSEKAEKDLKSGAPKLRTEALRDLVKSFAKNGERDSAIKYFVEKAGREGSIRYIVSLASEFFTAGGAQYDDAIKTYNWLLTERALDERAPDWQAKIVLSFDKKGNRAKVREESKRLVERYGMGSAWCQAQKPGVCERIQEIAEEALYGLVTDYHQEAIKTKSVATYKLARDIYKEYVDHFPTTERAYQMRFYYAEILYALEEYQNAFDQYVKVADFEAQKQLRTVAAKNMLLAAEKLLKIETGEYTIRMTDESKTIDEGKDKGGVSESHIKAKVEKGKEKQELTKIEKQLVAACDHYTELVPNADDESRVRLAAAVLFFDKYQYVEAADRFAVIIQKWPEETTSRTAATLVLESLETNEEWDALNKRAREFAANKKLIEGEAKGGKTDFAKKLQVYIEGATFKLAELLKGKDDNRAAELFTTYLKEFPKSKFAPIAGYNAFTIDQNTKHLDWALEVGEKVLKEYGVKGTPLYADSDEMRTLPGAEGGKLRDRLLADLTFRVAKTYELTADFDKAAALYESYAANPEFKDEDSVPDAQFNAALWYKGLGQDEKAIAAFKKYMAIYRKTPPEKREKLKLIGTDQVQWTICQFFETQKEWQKFYDCTTKEYLEGKELAADKIAIPNWQKMNARYHQFLAMQELKNTKTMTELAKVYIQPLYQPMTPEDKARDTTKLAMAHTSFFLFEPDFERYAALKFRSAQTLAADLKAMKEAQKALVTKYTTVVAYGNGDWAIAALVRIGVMPRLFANALRASPIPKYLDADQKDMYQSQIEDKALEIETPAVDLLLTAMNKSYELGIYNEWTLKAQSELAEFKPELVGKTYELPLKGTTFFFTADDKPATPAKPAEPKPEEKKQDKSAATSADTAQAGSGGGVQ